MFGWLMNPWMLGLGAVAVASPIIIHLLNKRRFRIIDWAAMDFLFEADRKNRRRVQLENFILLFLRCLAMLLLGLLLARPFIPHAVARIIQPNQKVERIMLIDDSLSTSVVREELPALDAARDTVTRLVTEFADSNRTEDWLTVVLTSNPQQPLLANEPVTRETLPTLLETIERIEVTDQRARYPEALTDWQRFFVGQQPNVTRMAYLFSDLREVDWRGEWDPESETAPNRLLNQIAEEAATCYLVDIGGENDQNLAVTQLRPLDLQVANRVVRYAAELVNWGTATIDRLRLVFQVDDAPPQYQVVANLPAGSSREIVFPFLFPAVDPDSNPAADDSSVVGASDFRNFRVVVEIDRQSMSRDDLRSDQLRADSTAYCAARIYDEIPVLLVDGDPSAVSERSETHYLKSLDVPGTGLRMTTVTATELETVSLSRYRVIFLCNVDEASPSRINSLKSWVEDGGNLVLMPGNRVRATTFNETFFEQGRGLSPLKLEAIAGDPTMSSWVNFEVDPQIHPALRTVVQSDRTSIGRVDVFSWWTSEFNAEQLGQTFVMPLRLSDDRHSPAMVEADRGTGRVVVFTIPGDGDWSMWPSSPTFAPVMIDLIDYLVGSVGETANVRVGGDIAYPVDLSLSESRVTLQDPQGERVEAVARPVEAGDSQAADDVLGRVQFDNISRRGFYEIGLKRHDGETTNVLFAANPDPLEGQLQRLPDSVAQGGFFSDRVRRTNATDIRNESTGAGQTEIWPQILWLLIGVLASEQLLGWWFGRRR